MKCIEWKSGFLEAFQFLKIILIAGILSTLGFGYLIYLKPQKESYWHLKQFEGALKQQLKTSRLSLVKLDRMRAEISLVHKILASSLNPLASGGKSPSLLESLFQQAKDQHLSINLFAPSSEKDHGFYRELTIKMSVKGHYHEMASFLGGLTGLLSAMQFRSFEISSSSSANSSQELLMKLTLKIYRLK
ncbi:type 4a pilus biogenesis protein PilO [Legionella jordanis]|uniref:Tfp pilus assembly protein PilO n=1 Tax=Legionella jordanis TaxID=456 RepID=A0A0W0V8G0_9GAMM|nr:type 4a pilus biogenesis protein PilO [Legionella jordanis]KTD16421.1 Tfp pilus assembly protein PilO [Legionella jordanis]RMX04377.1 hypothetical protein EAW55_02770 [Legionella jordanis]RMX15568.1 hypothetical protein EAS68_11965 [Legionella jordanis]VEH12119.1 Tfp pilus assembly protein PilO [Legionella jordanis]